MSKIQQHIIDLNNKGEKALAAFITAGFPTKEHFIDLACKVYEAGADILEIGVPFSDPLAEGPVIQYSSQRALKNGVTIADTFNFAKEIKSKIGKPLILMGYANPINKFGIKEFVQMSINSGVDGLIVADLPVEESNDFFGENIGDLDNILLTTPTSTDERIKIIDEQSSGFLYCVSVTGTTGIRTNFAEETLKNIDRTYKIVKKNKMLVGFGISNPERVKEFSPYCDGVIVGSAIVKSLMNEESEKGDFSKTINLIKNLKAACKQT